MEWIAQTEKDSAAAVLEKNLWDAADQFRANSGLKPQEYSVEAIARQSDRGWWRGLSRI